MNAIKNFVRKWARELIVVLLAAAGGWIGMSTAIFAAISFGGGYGLLVLLAGRGLMFILNAPLLFAPDSSLWIEQLLMVGEALVALWAFAAIYKKKDNVFLAGLPWIILLGIGHGIFKGLVLDMPMDKISFPGDKAILFTLMSLMAAFVDVFIAYMAHLFLDERMYKIHKRALARDGKLSSEETRRWM